MKEFERLFATNVRAPLRVVQRALPLMRDGSRIINISSGVTGFAIPEDVYSMSEGTLNVLTRSPALPRWRGITGNTVSPGIPEAT